MPGRVQTCSGGAGAFSHHTQPASPGFSTLWNQCYSTREQTCRAPSPVHSLDALVLPSFPLQHPPLGALPPTAPHGTLFFAIISPIFHPNVSGNASIYVSSFMTLDQLSPMPLFKYFSFTNSFFNLNPCILNRNFSSLLTGNQYHLPITEEENIKVNTRLEQ